MVINPLPVTAGDATDLFINLLASLLLFIFIFTGKGRMISKTEGVIFIGCYIVYMIYAVL